MKALVSIMVDLSNAHESQSEGSGVEEIDTTFV
jgi:hypothetical protein